MLSLSTNAGQVSDDLTGVVDAAAQSADDDAARLALALVEPRTPRRTGRLAAGTRSGAVPEGGFAVVNAVPYAPVVEERTGFVSETIVAAETEFVEIYDRHLQTEFDSI